MYLSGISPTSISTKVLKITTLAFKNSSNDFLQIFVKPILS